MVTNYCKSSHGLFKVVDKSGTSGVEHVLHFSKASFDWRMYSYLVVKNVMVENENLPLTLPPSFSRKV